MNEVILSRHPYGWRGLKYHIAIKKEGGIESPPVWVAWIEMPRINPRASAMARRHPYGWRGLKYFSAPFPRLYRIVATRMGGVD